MSKTGIERLGPRALMLVAATVIVALVLAGCGDKKSSGSGGNASGSDGANTAAAGDGGNGATEAGKQTSAARKAEEKKNFSSEPPPIQISSGDKTGFSVSKPTALVVKSKNEFKALQRRIFSNGVKNEGLVAIDFRTRQAVVLVMPKLQKGVIVVIVDVHQQGDKIVVAAVKMMPGDNCGTPDFKPNPYHIVETRKMTPNTVVVNVKRNLSSPCK